MTNTKSVLNIDTSDTDQKITYYLSGMLTKTTANTLWTAATKETNNRDVIFDLQGVTRGDSIGLMTLKELAARIESNDKKCEIINLQHDMQSLWDIYTKPDNAELIVPLEMQLNSMQRFGKMLCDQAVMMKQNLTYFGEIIYFLYYLLRHPSSLSFKKLCFYIDDMGPNSIPLVMLIGILFGVILTFQSAVQLKEFGAEIFVADLVSISLVRELGPLLVAIILTGRTASAYAAEISSMQVNQEIDALKTMGLDPVPFLVIPRLVAAAIVAPLLTILMNLFGMLGCAMVMYGEGFSGDVIVQQMFNYLTIPDLITGLVKPIFFGFLVVGLGCIHGLNCQRNALAVGKTTTATVVRCIIMITIMDGVFTTVFYYLGL